MKESTTTKVFWNLPTEMVAKVKAYAGFHNLKIEQAAAQLLAATTDNISVKMNNDN